MLRASSRYRLTTSRERLSHRRCNPLQNVAFYSDALLLSSVNYASSSGSSASRPPPSPLQPKEEEYLSDIEWELRTGEFTELNELAMLEGRAMDILQQTLPTFFTTGLVATNYHLPIHMHGLLGASLSSKGKGRADEHHDEHEEAIYERAIRLEYTPPVALPAPFPRVLSVEGLPLYVASSVFVRHTLSALYNDLAVSMHKVHVHSGTASPPNGVSPASLQLTPDRNGKGQRQRAITIGVLVSGMGRLGLSAERAEWDVTSTYQFCPSTGRIARHIVNGIDPAPSETVYTALQNALATLGRLGGPGGGGKGAMNVARWLKIGAEDEER